MTAQEFSDSFDVLYNNITSNQAPGLDEYEKSVFLTKAQDEILKAYFNYRLNKSAEGFDGNEKRQIDFSMVLKTVKISKNEKDKFETPILVSNKPNNVRVLIPNDLMLFINEFVDVQRDNAAVRLVAVPLGYQELARLSTKPYKRPIQYQAWRIIDNATGGNAAELILGANDDFSSYVIRYVKRPYPIILENLDGVTIEGKDKPLHKEATDSFFLPLMDNSNPDNPTQKKDGATPLYYKKDVTIEHACELDPILHEEILQRAVELAKAAYQGGLDSQIALGTNSQTNIGYVGGGQQQQQRQ